MKKRQVFGFVVAGLLAGFVSHAVAQSATAYSSSAVGVIKKTLPAGKRLLMSIPLDQDSDEGEGFIFSSVPAISNLPNGTSVGFWDVTNQVWVTQTKTARSGWGTQKNRRILAGEAFFLTSSSSSNIELVVSGEVPSDSAIAQALPNSARVLGANPYPVPTVLTNFTFASQVANGSSVGFWDVETQTWITQSKTARSGWGTQKNREVTPGEGFFVQSANSAVTWTETRPYTWPGN